MIASIYFVTVPGRNLSFIGHIISGYFKILKYYIRSVYLGVEIWCGDSPTIIARTST